MSIPTVYFRFLVGSAIIFRIFLINVFTLCTLVFVHHFCIVRCLTPRPLVHLRRVGECVGLTSVAPGKVFVCHTLQSVAPTPSLGGVCGSHPLLRERSSYATLCGQLCLPLPPHK